MMFRVYGIDAGEKSKLGARTTWMVLIDPPMVLIFHALPLYSIPRRT